MQITSEHQLYMAVGAVVVNWALLEQALDGIVSIAYHQCNGKSFEARIPIALAQKNRFLKDSFKKLPMLAPVQEDGLKLLHRIMNLAQRRDDFVHSRPVNMGHINGVFTFVHLKSESNIHKVREWKFDVKSFPKLLDSLQVLASDTANFALDLIQRYAK